MSASRSGRATRAQSSAAAGEADTEHTPVRRGAAVRNERVIEPDRLDRRIITMLQADGRCSNREIARSLGVPEATVRYRVRRLTDGGLLRITALIEPEKLGYDLTAVISVQAQAPLITAISETLMAFSEVMYLVVTTGVHDIVFTATFRNHDHMYHFISERLAPIQGVARIETAIGLRVLKREFEWAAELTSTLAEP
jgi:Lrp/AsnC family transcriptional regulator for asnA, asnC and gidA